MSDVLAYFQIGQCCTLQERRLHSGSSSLIRPLLYQRRTSSVNSTGMYTQACLYWNISCQQKSSLSGLCLHGETLNRILLVPKQTYTGELISPVCEPFDYKMVVGTLNVACWTVYESDFDLHNLCNYLFLDCQVNVIYKCLFLKVSCDIFTKASSKRSLKWS